MNRVGGSRSSRLLGFVPIALALVSCGDERNSDLEGRWFNASQVAAGKAVYEANCQSCHGVRGKGTANWKERLPGGALPPPPLDGTGHTWHHSRELLLRIIDQGGQLYDGNMPGFGNELTETEQVAVLAFIQSLWSDRVYSYWRERVDQQQ